MNSEEIYEKVIEKGFLISKTGMKESLRIQAQEIFKELEARYCYIDEYNFNCIPEEEIEFIKKKWCEE